MDGIQIFNNVIKKNIIDNTKYLKGRIHYMPTFLKIAKELNKQESIRQKYLSEDLTVPPIIILSVTNDCNLKCEGCYANSQDRDKELEMTSENLETVISDGVELGVAIFVIVGGEPLMKKGLLEVIEKYKSTAFVMFTNGTMISDEVKIKMKKMKQLIAIFSLEGSKEKTDTRRGEGVYDAVVAKMKLLNDNKMLFGSSITLTRENYDEVMSDEYIDNLQNLGCRILFLIEYVPCNGDKNLCLSEIQKHDLLIKIKHIQDKFDLLPVPLPGDEELFDGCLAAGRGFIHISSTGSIEACPFAPYSDVSVKTMPLVKALKSRLLTEIRINHNMLEEAEGGCTLFENPDLVSDLIKSREKRTCSSII